MFLFTTPASPPPPRQAPAAPVVDAIRYGSERSGAGFDYLLKTAQRESALDPSATTRASSATGLLQFIEQTWLGLVKREGDKHAARAGRARRPLDLSSFMQRRGSS
jgi:soluble lytic murein transglycosylase-like protein